MRIVDRRFIDKNIHTTRTRQHFGTLLGEKPHIMGQVVRMYPRLTISNLTEGLRNVYTNKKQQGGFTPINSYAIQWTIDVNYIKKIRIATTVTAPAAGQIFQVVLEEKYYNKNETFALEDQSQLFIVAPPKYLGPKKWQYSVRSIAVGASISDAMLTAGRQTKFRSNYHPELSVRGYVKYQFNTETHRNFLSKHRSSDVQSAEYAASQEYYIERGAKKAKGKLEYEYYRLQKLEKDVLESYLWARENHLLFGESNFDANGKCTMQDEKGQDIPIGDGVIKQIERYCEKFVYSVLTTRWLENIMASMREKSPNSIGNSYAFVVNERLYDQIGRLLRDDLRFIGQGDDRHYWTNQNGNKIKVGAHYDSYTFQGNTVVFMVDKILSDEYPDSGYGFCINTGVDQTTTNSGISMFTLEGREMLSGKLRGMGGFSGKESGVDIATSVDGSEYHLLGYSAVTVFNPYNAAIIKESFVI
ncbi:MAG: hypothetical protein KAH32_03095 [Chlamydiia bacterium]|nr:hypothetical protein [Chlamydiia bacterium]